LGTNGIPPIVRRNTPGVFFLQRPVRQVQALTEDAPFRSAAGNCGKSRIYLRGDFK